MKKYGTTWDAVELDNFTLDDIDIDTVNKFKLLAKDRLPLLILTTEVDLLEIITKLNLYNGNMFNRVAVLLFAKNPKCPLMP